MTTFPTLTPGSRTFTPGEYPHSSFVGMSGAQNRVRNSNVMLGSQLRLTFAAISESQMLSILQHYNGQTGGFSSFALPTSVWSGVGSIGDYQLAGYGWIYTQPPTVSDAMCADAYDVEVTLETVPPESTPIAGLDQQVRLIFAAGVPASVVYSGFMINWSIAGGLPDAVGLNQAVTWSFAAGAAEQPPATDPSFSSVQLLLHMDGANGSTSFTDNSAAGTAITANGNAQISTAQSKFGGAAGLFDGTGDFLSFSGISVGSSTNCTIECWFYRIGGEALIGDPGASNFQLLAVLNGLLYAFWNGNEVEGGTVTNNTWHHAAITRSSGTIRLFLNGTQVASSAGNTQSFSVTRVARAVFRQDFNGYIDDVRITVGVARYTANFTPPTAAFPNS